MPRSNDAEILKMDSKQKTEAIRRYARVHGFYQSTVRKMTSLRRAALNEWIDKRYNETMEVYR
jgi:hypothetical protein